VDLRLPNRPTLRLGPVQGDEILQSSQTTVE